MELPPQRLKQEVRDLAANQDIQSLRNAAALDAFGPRLPVLQAFREFVEVERRRAQKRLMVLAACFVAVLLLLGAVATVMGLRFAGQFRGQVAALQADLSAAGQEATALQDRTTTLQQVVEAVRAELAALREKMEAQPAVVAPPPASAPDLTPVLGLLQELHRLRTGQTDLAAQYTLVQDGLRRWSAEEEVRAGREQQLRRAQVDWSKDVAEFVNRQTALEVRQKALTEAPPPPPAAPAKKEKGRSKKQTAPPALPALDPTAALALMDEVQQLQAQQPLLESRRAELMRDLAQAGKEREESLARHAQLAAQLATVKQALADLEVSQQDVQSRLAEISAVRTAAN